MLSDLGIALVTLSGITLVCILPVIYCIKRCSKRVIIMPDSRKVHVQVASTINTTANNDDDDNTEEKHESG